MVYFTYTQIYDIDMRICCILKGFSVAKDVGHSCSQVNYLNLVWLRKF